MASFLFALLLGGLATLGGREAVRLARLAAGLGPAAGLMVAACVAGLLSTAFVAAIGLALAGIVSGAMQPFASAAVLVAAAGHLLVARAPPQPKEPTRSFVAILTVLTVAQACDPARLLLLALLLMGVPALPAAWGIGMGSLAVLLCAGLRGSRWETRLPLPLLRVTGSLAAGGGAIALIADVLPLS